MSLSDKTLKAAVGAANADKDRKYELDLENYYNNIAQEEEGRKLKDEQNLQQYEYQTGIKAAQEQAQTNAYIRSNEVYQDNLKSIDFYSKTAQKRVQLGLDEEIANLSFQLEDLDRDFARNALASAFGDTQQQQIIDNAVENAELAKKELAIQKGQRKAEFDAKFANIAQQEEKIAGEYDIEQRRIQGFDIEQRKLTGQLDIEQRKLGELDIQKKRSRAETRYQQLNNQLETIIQKGAAQARGTMGRSAGRVINSIAAMSGVNTQKFNDSLYLAEESIALQKATGQQSIDLRRTTGTEEIALQKGTAEQASALQKLLGEKGVATEKQLTKSQKLSILGDKTAKKDSASYLGALEIQKASIKAGRRQTKAAAKLKQDNIAETLGIDVEEFELSKEKLAESLMSAGESAKIKLEQIEDKKFEAKSQAYAQRMLKPVFGPALPQPFKTPKTKYIKPKPPIYSTKYSVRAGLGASGYSSAPQPSTLSTALGIGSTVAGIAAPFSGPAAPVVGAAAAGLGFLSQLFK